MKSVRMFLYGGYNCHYYFAIKFQITFMVIFKLKFVKILRTKSVFMQDRNLREFWVITAPDLVRFCWNLHQRFILAEKDSVFKESLKKLNF